MRVLRTWITTQRVVIAVGVVAVLLEAVCLYVWVYWPQVEPSKSVNHGLSAKHRAILYNIGDPLAWAPHSQVLAAFRHSGVVLWDVAKGERVALLPSGIAEGALAWGPDGNRLATGTRDGTACLWNTKTRERLMTLSDHIGWIHDLAWSPDGNTLAIGGGNRVVLWDVRSGKARNKLEWDFTPFYNVAWSPDGKSLACGSQGITLLWDLVSEKPRATLSGSGPRWSPDGKTLYTGEDDIVFFWDANTARERARLTSRGRRFACLAWSPDGKTLATGSEDEGAFWRGLVPDRYLSPVAEVVLWDTTTFKPRFTLIGHRNEISSLAWSPDGRNLASGSWDDSVIIWDAPTGTRAATLSEGIGSSIENVAWSPDGKSIATTFGRRTILWEIVRTADGAGTK